MGSMSSQNYENFKFRRIWHVESTPNKCMTLGNKDFATEENYSAMDQFEHANSESKTRICLACQNFKLQKSLIKMFCSSSII